MQQYRSNSYLFGGNAPYVEEMYEAYLDNPGSRARQLARVFRRAAERARRRRHQRHATSPHAPGHRRPSPQRAKAKAPSAVKASRRRPRSRAASASPSSQLIAAYRIPRRALGRPRSAEAPGAPEDPRARACVLRLHRRRHGHRVQHQQHLLRPAEHDDAARDRCRRCARPTAARSAPSTCTSPTRPRSAGGSSGSNRSAPSRPSRAEKKKHILERLTAAEGLERYLHTKYVGQKRFSLEGGESFIASMDELIQRAGAKGVQEIVIGMAHRGRLNVLVNTLGKMPAGPVRRVRPHRAGRPAGRRRQVPPGLLSRRHDAAAARCTCRWRSTPRTSRSSTRWSKARCKARMDRRGDAEGEQVLPVLVHGDAAFAGQGVVMETLALAQTRGYYTGGTVHIVINNQIGFTTSDPRDSALDAVLHRRRQDDRGAGAARERRRPGGGGAGTQLALDYRHGVPQGRRGRHRLLPQARPQRAGHAGADAAADVQEDRRSTPARASCTPTSWPRRACWRRRSATTWSRPTAPRWTPASTPSTRC